MLTTISDKEVIVIFERKLKCFFFFFPRGAGGTGSPLEMMRNDVSAVVCPMLVNSDVYNTEGATSCTPI